MSVANLTSDPQQPAQGLPAHLQGLLRAAAYPHATGEIRLVETHISWVLLTGKIAYKIKRPVHYPFVDQRSAERRAFLCAEEVRLNRRFAPSLYLGVCKIVATTAGIRIADEGEPVEFAVRMRQFDAGDSLDRLIEHGNLTAGELEELGGDLAVIHAGLPHAPATEAWGSAAHVQLQIRRNLQECRQLAQLRDTPELGPLADTLAAWVCGLTREIDCRREQKRVRECHGDLHARNVARYEGRLVAFDCLEFEPAFRWIDVAEEVAFLWMDLVARRRADLAFSFLSGYLAQSGDFRLCRLLRLYGAHRALVRAKVVAMERSTARCPADYLDCARNLLAPVRPRLVLMHGLSGSGKTCLARQLAGLMGAVHLRSDVERKRLADLAPQADSHSGIARGLYSQESTRRIYEHLARCASAVLAGGFTAIVDATFAQRSERARFADLAAVRGAELVIVRCHAPMAILEKRLIERRARGDDASEANLDVLRWQRSHVEAIGASERLIVIDADTTDPSAAAQVRAAIEAHPDSHRSRRCPPR